MTKHTCKNCNSIFEYCRGCLLSPIPYKDAGYCSKSCYEASKIKVVPEVIIEPIVEEIVAKEVMNDIIPIEEEVSMEVEAETIVKEEAPIEVEAKVMTLEDIPTETAIVAESTTKQETYNAYKKKKKKHK